MISSLDVDGDNHFHGPARCHVPCTHRVDTFSFQCQLASGDNLSNLSLYNRPVESLHHQVVVSNVLPYSLAFAIVTAPTMSAITLVSKQFCSSGLNVPYVLVRKLAW